MSNRKQKLPGPDMWVVGEAYEAYVGRWSRVVAREFLNWLDISPGARWLDVGCGTGILSRAILQWADPGEVKGIDFSAAFIAYARDQVADERVSFEVGDAQQLPVENGRYDAVVSGLVLNFVPDKPQALREMARAAKPGGRVAAYVWDYAGGIQVMRYFWDAVTALHSDAVGLDEARRFPMCEPEELDALFQESGLSQVEVRSIDILTSFRDFEDYWTPFLGGQGPAPSYVSSLNERERAELRDYLQARLPTAADGSIELTARAWAVRGLRPVEQSDLTP